MKDATDENLVVRPEARQDLEAIHKLNVAAFGSAAEADLVDCLREGEGTFLSFVAEQDGRVVGHILFTEVTADGSGGSSVGLGLAPMAVAPPHQRRGVGSALVRSGLAACRDQHAAFVVVLGHPEYYPRFGFLRADGLGLEYEDPVPPEAFMVLVLDENAPLAKPGVVRYRPEFRVASGDHG